MNRRHFLNIVCGTLVSKTLPTRIISWDVVKLKEVISPPPLDLSRGYKGSEFLEVGYVYAPYIPLLITDYEFYTTKIS